MFSRLPHRRLVVDLLALAATVFLLVFSVQSIALHAQVIRSMSKDALPTAAKIPPLQERLTILKRQVDAATATISQKSGALRENLFAYVLPSDGAKRVVATLSGLGDALKAEGELRSQSSIELGDEQPADLTLTGSELNTRSVDVSMEVTQAGLEDVLHALDLSGRMTVSDALSQDQIQRLLTLTERESPTGVVALQQYLATDLLKYLRDPETYDRRLLSNFSSDTFPQEFTKITQSAFAGSIALMKSGMHGTFSQSGFWPMPFLETKQAEVSDLDGGWMRLTLHLAMFARRS